MALFAGEPKQGTHDRPPAQENPQSGSRQQVWDYEIHPPRPAVMRFQGTLARIAKQLLPGAKVDSDESGARIAKLEVRNLRGLVRPGARLGVRRRAARARGRAKDGSRDPLLGRREHALSAAYDLARTRRLLLLLSAAALTLPGTMGLPLARAVEITGAKNEREVLADVAVLAGIWTDPADGEQPIDLSQRQPLARIPVV